MTIIENKSNSDFYNVYMLSDKDVNPYYVGITNNLSRRRLEHLNLMKSNNQLPKYRKARKIGELYINIIIDGFDIELAKVLEESYIKHYTDEGYKLYNLTEGGNGRKGFITSELTKRKISESKKGTKWGHHTDETKKKLSLLKKGKKFTKEHRENLKIAWKNRSRTITDETRKKRSKAMKGKINIKKYVLTSPSGKEYTTTEGLTKFCEEHNLQASNMIKVLNGERMHHKGWKVWRKNNEPNNR